MIEEAPWLGPLIAWGVVITLLLLIVVAAITRDGARPSDYIATLIGSLFVAAAGAIAALHPTLLYDTLTLDELGLTVATLRGIGMAIYIGVLMRISGWPRWMREMFHV
jgi:hypothetical protein